MRRTNTHARARPMRRSCLRTRFLLAEKAQSGIASKPISLLVPEIRSFDARLSDHLATILSVCPHLGLAKNESYA